MLVIHKSCLQPADNGTVRLVTPVTETAGGSSTRHEIWVEVDEAYKEFLCLERCDAMLLGLLHYAMEKGHDIQAELPVSRELYFNLTNLLIPLLCGEKETVYKKVALQMTVTAERLPNAGAVGTGISLGIDSFYTISRHIRADAEGVSRFEKTRYLSNVEMAQKYLYVCTRSTENCCRKKP